MNESKIQSFKLPEVREFDFQIKYTKTDRYSHTHEIDLHTHREFEIYVNLSGDISFLIENKLYALTRGDVIVARPGEHHHCVYRSGEEHRLFWILFDCEKNPHLTSFFRRSDVNYVSPTESVKNELIEICSRLTEDADGGDRLYYFLRLLKLIEEGSRDSADGNRMPEDFRLILAFVDKHLAEDLRVADIAQELFVSKSTVERKFKEYVGMTPLDYIQRKRLFLSAELLKKGETVLNAGLGVGYTDNSYFIQLFRRQFGITPYQYKRSLQNNE
ncbi:MAG: helix-turn-helix transcriptional regulator [Clostridia bacterium]|nr:helix-turn-helix transcriptional regulator [Clostridia bacterium]